MGQIRVANDAYGVLSVAAATTDTTLTLQSGQGARFPAIAAGSGDWFYATIINGVGSKEICQCTGITGDVLTVTRGVDGTTAQAFAAGNNVQVRWNAATISDLQTQMRTAMLAKMNQYLPVGIIALYNGSASSIPSGWQLCDGTNGTPNLKDTFVIGAGITAAVGTTGGATAITITAAAMPQHNHTFTDTGHIHAVVETPHGHPVNDPGHQHQWDVETGTGGTYELVEGVGVTNEGSYNSTGSTTGISIVQTVANVTINSALTGITMNNNGSGTAIGTLPPYYAQAFIQKVAAWV